MEGSTMEIGNSVEYNIENDMYDFIFNTLRAETINDTDFKLRGIIFTSLWSQTDNSTTFNYEIR